MPIYEFECQSCGHQFEELVLPWLEKENPARKPECPSCHDQHVERTLSICAVSSEGTRQASLQKARKKLSSVQKEKDTEEFKEMIEHANEHH